MTSAKTKSSILLGNLRRQFDDDDENSYLSKKTISRREDQKLLNRITSTLYRLELENVKPSFDVKLRTGLHRGPYKSKRGRRSQSIARNDSGAESSYGRAYGLRASSCAPVSTPVDLYGLERPVHLPYRVNRRPDFDENDDEQLILPHTIAAATTSVTDDQWLPTVDNYRRRRYDNPFFRATIERYASKSGKWLQEIERIDEETRRRKALSAPGFELEPTTTHRSRTSDEYNDLLSVLAREDASNETGKTSLSVGRSFFDDEPASAVDDGEEFLQQLMDRPFARGVRTNESLDNRRAVRASDSSNFY